MAVRSYRPTSPARRFYDVVTSEELTKKKPERRLTRYLTSTGGRNARGRITVRHRGGGHKRQYRMVDFKWTQKDVPGRIAAVEYDPNRNVRIGLVFYRNGAKTYILLPAGLKVGSIVLASEKAEAKVGSSLPLSKIPVGFIVHNIEMFPGSGAK